LKAEAFVKEMEELLRWMDHLTQDIMMLKNDIKRNKVYGYQKCVVKGEEDACN
jgi:hypothetical protein